jgi:hypothetical protein
MKKLTDKQKEEIGKYAGITLGILAFGQIIQDNPDIFKIKKKLKNK